MCIQVTSNVACLETYKNIKPLNLQPLISHRRLFPHQAELRLHWSISLASAFSTVFSQKRFALLLKTDIVTVHLPLASYAGVFRGTRLSSLPTRDKRRAPLKKPTWEANLLRDSVKFCALFKGFVWATRGSDMKIVIEFARNVFYSSDKSGNLVIKAQRNYKKTTLDNLPTSLENIPSILGWCLENWEGPGEHHRTAESSQRPSIKII